MKRIIRNVPFLLYMAPVIAILLLSGQEKAGYKMAMEEREFTRMLANAARITFMALLGHMPYALLCGVYLARRQTRFAKLMRALMLLMLLMPFQVIMMPVYKMTVALGLYDTQWMPVLLIVFSPIGPLMVYVLTKRIEESQLEAASLETDSVLQIVLRIVLPQIASGLLLLMLLMFAEAWNMVEQPLILIKDWKDQPVSLLFDDIRSKAPQYMYSGSVIYMSPVLLVYLLAGAGVLWRKMRKTEQ